MFINILNISQSGIIWQVIYFYISYHGKKLYNSSNILYHFLSLLFLFLFLFETVRHIEKYFYSFYYCKYTLAIYCTIM